MVVSIGSEPTVAVNRRLTKRHSSRFPISGAIFVEVILCTACAVRSAWRWQLKAWKVTGRVRLLVRAVPASEESVKPWAEWLNFGQSKQTIRVVPASQAPQQYHPCRQN